ncbi:hypothetical protein HaLaN_30756, partial [Haematococcus lacustris]
MLRRAQVEYDRGASGSGQGQGEQDVIAER